MSELILYHYAQSPYSEKIRLMLGYAGLSWRSVTVPAMPPRPELAILTGGYRRVPVAQIGADVYCDTRSIAARLARLANRPELDINQADEATQAFARHADTRVFLAVFGAATGGLLRWLLQEIGPRHTLRFIADRIGIARRAKVPAPAGRKACDVIAGQLADMEQRLSAEFLFGDTPCAADFSAAFGLWFAHKIGAPLPPDTPRVDAWYARMQAFGHGVAEPMSAAQGLEVAHGAEPAELGELAVADPRPVSIAPRDYARDPIAGLLVGESLRAWVLRREHPRVGSVHVHFPKTGFGLREQPA